MEAVTAQIQSGTELVSFSSLTQTTVTVTFPVPFAVAPVVMTNIASSAGAALRWDSRAYALLTTGFTLFLYSNDGTTAQTWSSMPVSWLAYRA